MIPCSAYILAGGTSRRFGSPKWKAEVAGQTLLHRARILCSPLFQNTYVVTKGGQGPIGGPTIFDSVDFQSPLSGVYSALRSSNDQWIFVLSCDLPLISEDIIRFLWQGTSSSIDAVVPKTSRGLEPTCAFYSVSVLTVCERMITRNNYALHQLVAQSKSRVIDFSQRDAQFINVNTKEELEKVRRILEKKRNAG